MVQLPPITSLNLGAKIVGIIDRVGGVINPDGFTFEEIKQFFLDKDGNALQVDGMLSFEEVNSQIWDIEAEVFLPCAASRLVSKDQIERMISSGLEVVASGANVPFADEAIFYGPIAELADKSVSVIPDFMANCGMARVFAYLMSAGDVDMSDEAIFVDTSKTIRNAIVAAHEQSSAKTEITATAFAIALKKLL